MSSFALSDRARTARRLTEAAARACAPWIGASDKEAADAAAVDAMRSCLSDVGLAGTVVIGEGEKDDAPYLAPGTEFGASASEARVDVAVDPLEGTELVASDAPGALSVLALAPAGTMMRLGRAFYAEKLIGPPAAQSVLDLDAPPGRVVQDVADAIDVRPGDVRVAVQKRPRHRGLVEALRAAGAQVRLFAEGDLSFAILALQSRTEGAEERGPSGRTGPIDLLWGIGGAPEGMLAAAAQRAVGGAVRLRLAPRSEDERSRLYNDGSLPDVLGRTFSARDLVQTRNVVIAITGVTDGPLLSGLRKDTDGIDTETLVLGPDS